MSLRNPSSVAYQQIRSGRYHMINSTSDATATSAGMTSGTLRLGPWIVPNACTLTRIGAQVTAAGTAGCTYRLVIYSDNGSEYPGGLLLDAGTIAGDSATVQEITISQALTPGMYWVGGVLQGSPASQPTISILSRTNTPLIAWDTTIPVSQQAAYGFYCTGAGTTLPGTFSSTVSLTGLIPRIFVKAA